MDFGNWRSGRLEENTSHAMIVTGPSDDDLVIFFRILTLNLLNIAMQPSSHIWLMDKREYVFSSYRMNTCCALFESSLERGTLACRELVMTPSFVTVVSSCLNW